MINILYVIMGASSVGKDCLVNELKNKYDYEICVSLSSRPKRINELNGKDYFFISEEEFLHKVNNNEFLETRTYKTANGLWYYGLDRKSVDLNKTQLVIIDAKGYKTIVEALGQENVVGIYVYADEREKVTRALNREQNREDMKYFEELYRRMLDDLTAFNIIKDDDRIFKVKNKNGDFYKAVGEIWNIINCKNQFEVAETPEEKDLEIGDHVEIVKINNTEKAFHLTYYLSKTGIVKSWIINGEKRYKVFFDSGETAYFLRNEIHKVGDI